MTTGTALLIAATQTLRAAGVNDPARDARVLLAHALGIDRSRLTLALPDEVAQEAEAVFAASINARTARQPVAQIIGKRAFYGRDFYVTSDVLDPRPDTERLVETALDHPFDTVVDLGCGSGCILLTLLAERPLATGQGVDISAPALGVAQKNASQLALTDRAAFVEGSWFDPLAKAEPVDLIVSNPPYISEAEMRALAPELRDWEPHVALTPGGDGLAAFRIIVAQAPDFLRPKGRLIVEIGATQGRAVSGLFESAGFQSVRVVQDLTGHDRVVTGFWQGS